MKSRTNLRLASFDSGGVYGLSQLKIMSNIMHRLNRASDLNDSEAILPYQHFDLIGGSGTGGLIAIMLAKLRMSADEAAEEFGAIINHVFGPFDITPKERTGKLRACLEDMMKRKDLPLDMKLVDEAQTDGCACFVVASLQNISSTICLRSYPVRSHQILPITVIEAALASCATISQFDPVTVGIGRKRKEYIAAGLGATNPIREVITQARSLFGGDSTAACLLSVGTGHPGIITLTPGQDDVTPHKIMQDIMNDCKQMAQEVEGQISQSGIYYRFSVEHEMQKNISNIMDMACIITQTETYLEEQKKQLEAFAECIRGLPSVISLDQLESGEVIMGPVRMLADGNTGRLEEIGRIYQENVVARLKPPNVESSCPVDECMEGTREDILRIALDWVADSGATNIFWLKGYPGVGKSAIAASLVKKLRDMARLGASFFFQRERSNAMTTSALWRTVAYGLASEYPPLRNYLISTLETDEAVVATVSIEKLFRKLIHEPLVAFEEAGGQDTVVVVIDALDECGGLDGQHSSQRTNLMRTLEIWSTLPKRFKLVVTSRAEPDIVRLFSTIEHESFEILSGKMVQSKSSEDIEKFLQYHLGQIAARSNGTLAPDWPGRQIKAWFTRLAAGLFIWVDTAVRFLRQGEPQEQLNRILGGTGMGGLATLYSSILGASFVEPTEKVLGNFRRIVGAIILAKEPLTASSLIHLCSVDHSMLSYIRNGLQSVMDTGEALRFSHQSFVDFLLNSTECRPGFLINLHQQKRYMTLGCFRIMKWHLRFNICDIKSSHKRNNDVAGLERRIKERIPPHLAYSCHYWANHLPAAFDPEISEHIDYFVQNQFLVWLEVLSLTKRVNLGTNMIGRLIEWLRNGNQDDKLARDMKKFIAAFGSIISQSVPHIYLSALPLSPRLAGVSKQYMNDYPRTIRIKRGGQDNWPAIQNVIVGHKDPVNSVVFSSDGTRVISDSWDSAIRVWDAETAEPIAGPFRGHGTEDISMAFSPDGKRTAFGSWKGTIRVWDTETGEMVAGPFEVHTSKITCVAFSSDGKRIVSGSSDSTLRVCDAETGEMVAGPFEGHTSKVTCVEFSPNGIRIASGCRDGIIWVWNARTAETVAGPFQGHTETVTCLAFSPDGARIVSGSWDQRIRVWDTETSEMVVGPLQVRGGWVNSVSYSPDGTRFVSGFDDKAIRVWDPKTGEIVAGPFKGHTSKVTCVAFSPDGTRIVSGSRDSTIRVWDAEAVETSAVPSEGHTDGVSCAAFSPDGTRIVSSSWDNTIRVWDVETRGTVTGPFIGHTQKVNSVAFSPDGTRIASGARDNTIRVWDVETATTVVGPFKGHTREVKSVVFSPDGTRIASGSADNKIRVWDAKTAETVVGPFQGHTKMVLSVAFSPDGTRIASGSMDNTIRVWDAETGEVVVGPFEGHTREVKSVVFSPDGTRIASGSLDHTIRVWDANTAETVAGPFKGHTHEVASVAFSPDGSRIVSGSGDRTIRVWDVQSAEMVTRPFEGHTGGVSSVAFSPDGTRIVSGSWDKTIRVWNARNAEVISRPINGHAEGVGLAAFSPNQPSIASTSEDESNHLWRTTALSSLLPPSAGIPALWDGWILGSNSELLFWVPPVMRTGLFWPSTILIIGECLQTELNLEHFVHGEAWVRCRDPLLDQASPSQSQMDQVATVVRNAKPKTPLDGYEERQMLGVSTRQWM